MKQQTSPTFRTARPARAVGAGVAALALVMAGAVSGAASAGRTAGADLAALDYAFRFASAIEVDPKDKAQAQELAVLEYARAGAFQEALERAERVEGWRKASVIAELSVRLADEGRVEEARTLARRAEAIQSSVTGWQKERVAAQIAQALARLGDLDRARAISTRLSQEDPAQYKGRAAATVATGHAARGEFLPAMQELAGIPGGDDLDASWWRAAGYLSIAREKNLDRAERLRALEAARAAADKVAGWRQAEALLAVADGYRALGELGQAREILRSAGATIDGMPPGAKPIMLASLAAGLARSGETRRALTLLKEAEPLISRALLIDRPGIIAALASAHHELGDGGAGRLLERSLTSAAELENARPRALAAAAICRHMGRHRMPLDAATRARLDSLLAGLRDPW